MEATDFRTLHKGSREFLVVYVSLRGENHYRGDATFEVLTEEDFDRRFSPRLGILTHSGEDRTSWPRQILPREKKYSSITRARG